MRIVVNDASIIIDILKIDILPCFLKLDVEKYISSLVLDTEIEKENKIDLLDAVHNNKIKNDPCTEGLAMIGELKNKHPALSLPDCSCLYLAQKINAILLTGEKKMTSIARSKGIEVHGILWLLEELIENNIISYETAHERLHRLMSINFRLPKEECTRRLTLWKRKFSVN